MVDGLDHRVAAHLNAELGQTIEGIVAQWLLECCEQPISRINEYHFRSRPSLSKPILLLAEGEQLYDRTSGLHSCRTAADNDEVKPSIFTDRQRIV